MNDTFFESLNYTLNLNYKINLFKPTYFETTDSKVKIKKTKFKKHVDYYLSKDCGMWISIRSLSVK